MFSYWFIGEKQRQVVFRNTSFHIPEDSFGRSQVILNRNTFWNYLNGFCTLQYFLFLYRTIFFFSRNHTAWCGSISKLQLGFRPLFYNFELSIHNSTPELSIHNTTRTSSAVDTLCFTPSSNLWSATYCVLRKRLRVKRCNSVPQDTVSKHLVTH